MACCQQLGLLVVLYLISINIVSTNVTMAFVKNVRIAYLLTATFIGTLMGVYSAKLFSFYFGIIFLVSLLVLYLFRQSLVGKGKV